MSKKRKTLSWQCVSFQKRFPFLSYAKPLRLSRKKPRIRAYAGLKSIGKAGYGVTGRGSSGSGVAPGSGVTGSVGGVAGSGFGVEGTVVLPWPEDGVEGGV